MANFYVGKPLIEQPSAFQSLASGLGQGLGTGLQSLAHMKMQQLHSQAQQKAQSGVKALQQIMPDLSEEDAVELDKLPPSMKSLFYRNYLSGLEQSQQPQMTQALNSLGQQPQQAQQPEFRSRSAQQVMGYEAPEDVLKPELMSQAKPLSAAERKEKALLAKEERKALADQEKIERKFYDEQIKVDKSAKENDIRLKRMRTLVNTGKMPLSALYGAFKGLESGVSHIPGVGGAAASIIAPITNILSGKYSTFSPKDVEEFEKLSNDFIRGAKEIFGSRVTNADLEAFYKIIPTLSQSDEGKLRIMNNMQGFNDAIHARAKVAKDLVKENGNKLPKFLNALVEERVQPQLDEIAKKIELGYGQYDLGVNNAKLPPANKSPVGAQTKIKGQRYINVLDERGQRWQPISK